MSEELTEGVAELEAKLFKEMRENEEIRGIVLATKWAALDGNWDVYDSLIKDLWSWAKGSE